MYVIGLCGGSGSGKTTACDTFRICGAAVIDTDSVYRQITSGPGECMHELVAAFGDEISNKDGSLDRRTLSSIVFADKSRLELLNDITHKYIREKTVELLQKYESSGFDAAVVDAPVLFESRFNELCDVTVGVIADRDKRIDRIMMRDGISYKMAEMRIDSQYSNEFLTIRCDYIIANNQTLAELCRAVANVYIEIIDSGVKC